MLPPLSSIRNFTIISHIDHGKSTLADRFLELTKTIPKQKLVEQYLDKMSLERERGITIKMHPCRMIWRPNHSEIPGAKSQTTNNLKSGICDLKFSNSEYVLNLIDTPGHVDFSYEVSRALAAVEGAILLVDATKGIQAQTIANLELARKENLTIIPVVNKIDLANQDRIRKVQREIANLLSQDPSEVLPISAKKGIGIKELISKILEKIPCPSGFRKDSPGVSPSDHLEKPFQALIFDSKYDPFQGVATYIRVVEGGLQKGEEIYLLRKKTKGIAKEIGYFLPEFTPCERISTGEIGYVKTGIREPEKVRVGDTIIKISNHESKIPIKKIEPLPGYQEPQPVVFTSLFPKEPTTFENLKKSLEELHLSDPSFTFKEIQRIITKIQVYRGFQCGFLGLLHIEIILERLKREFSLSIFIARPTVSYQIIDKENKKYMISSAQDWPETSSIRKVSEPWAKVEILTPQEYFNNIFKLFPLFKINFLSSKSFSKENLIIECEMPFRKLIENFYDKLKSVSRGFASMSFKISDYKTADLAKIDILIAKKKEPSLSKIVEKDDVQKEGRNIVEKLKEIFPRQLFPVAVQAAVGGKIIARETVKALRKDVTGPLYGGDITRKMKLLQKQKRGKERLEEKAKIAIPPEVIIKLLKE